MDKIYIMIFVHLYPGGSQKTWIISILEHKKALPGRESSYNSTILIKNLNIAYRYTVQVL